MTWAAVLASALLLASDGIAVHPAKPNAPLAAWRANLAALDKPSDRTHETLSRLDLDSKYRQDPEGAIALLERAARKAPSADLVYALAELSWVEGQHIENRRPFDRKRNAAAAERYIDTVAYAWDYLFDPEISAGRHPSDPRFRLACDLYNASLDRLIHAAAAKGPIQPGGIVTLKINGREHALRVSLRYGSWSEQDVQKVLVASDFEVTGLNSKSRQYGLGVPLIGIRSPANPPTPLDRYFANETAFPLTAILRPNSKLKDDPDQGDGPRTCTLELVDPVAFPLLDSNAPRPSITYQISDPALPLEADLTTPLAYMSSRTDFGKLRWTGLLRPEAAAHRQGLLLIRPYDPDKIPVVMIHGLASSPLAWIPMLNELYRDPQIHNRFQFLLYVYPTGVPIPIAAASLRDALADAKRSFDQPGLTPESEFNQMVLLGHSMGGILAHAMAVNSENRYWQMYTDRPFDQMLGPPETLAELRRYFFFEAVPAVQRVVFLATPHRGSELSTKFVGRVGSSLIAEPDEIAKLFSQLAKRNPDAFDRKSFRHVPTSIETLSPDSEILQALLEMNPPQNRKIHFHSIIGSERAGRLSSTSDGVVAYTSAHLDHVDSESVVRSDHGVQKDPEAILEVRRILLMHLNSSPTQTADSKTPATPR
jgi:pimeloyl-ACP methyl ester carboxylesterase